MNMKSITLWALAGVWALARPLQAQEPDTTLALQSLDELLNIKISAAAKYEQTISAAPASVTIITAEDINAYGYETLEDVFKSVRGFYTSYDRNYSYLGVRGFSRPTDYNNRILVLINGHTTNENYYGSAYLGTELGLNLDMIERIEIVRGPSSALYGTNALFAIINVVTREGKAVDGLEVSAAAGSYGTRRGAAQFGREFQNGTDFMLAGRWSRSDGQDHYYAEYNDSTGNGVAKNLDGEENYSLFGTLQYKNFSGQAFHSWRKKCIPTGAYGMQFNDPAAQTRDVRNFVEAKYEVTLSANKNLMARAFYDHYDYRGIYPYEYDYVETTTGKWFGSELQLRWDPRPNNRFIIGIEALKHIRAYNHGEDETTIFFDGNFPYTNRSLYVQDEYEPVKNLALTVGLRLDKYPKTDTEPSPRLAVVYHLRPSSSLKLLYGEAFRTPSASELIAEKLETEVVPPLKPERIKTAELVLEQRLNAAMFGTVSVYNYKMCDLIDRVAFPGDVNPHFRNLDHVEAYGMEIEMNLRPGPRWRGFTNYTYQHARDGHGKKKILTNSPRHLLKLGAVAPVGNYFNAVLEAQYETERRTVYNKIFTKAYLLANLRLITAAPARGNALLAHFQLGLSINNLFDVTYQTPGGLEHLQPGIAQNRRHYMLKVQHNL